MNDFNLHLEGTKVLSESILNGIDVSNVIASISTQGVHLTYTAVQDCFVVVDYTSNSGSVYLKIDNVVISYAQGMNGLLYLLKKGQTIDYLGTSNTNSHFYAYGLKR